MGVVVAAISVLGRFSGRARKKEEDLGGGVRCIRGIEVGNW